LPGPTLHKTGMIILGGGGCCQIADPSIGASYYYNPRTGWTSWDRPGLFGPEGGWRVHKKVRLERGFGHLCIVGFGGLAPIASVSGEWIIIVSDVGGWPVGARGRRTPGNGPASAGLPSPA
jgi:hypothetical protein